MLRDNHLLGPVHRGGEVCLQYLDIAFKMLKVIEKL